jgi:hypothetical protein
MTLKGIANKEEKNVTDIETFKIDTIFSFEVIANIYKDIGRIVIEVNAVKNEILVNTLKFSLFKKSLHLLKIMIVHLELCYNGH